MILKERCFKHVVNMTGLDGGPGKILTKYELTNVRFLIHIIFIRDNVPVISLETWPLNCALFDGLSTAGPIPTLFSEDVAATLDNIRKNVQKSHHDIQRAMKGKLTKPRRENQKILHKRQMNPLLMFRNFRSIE
jgi:hypothetical protein